MAGKIDFTISANADKAMQEMAKVVNKQEQVIDKLKKQNVEAGKAKKSFEDMGKPLGSIVGRVGEMAAGFLSAQAVIGGIRTGVRLLKDEFDDYVRKTKVYGEGQLKFNRDMIETMRSYFGVNQNIDAEMERFKRALPSNITPDQGVQMLSRFGGAYPTSNMDQAIAAIQASAGPISHTGRMNRIDMVGQIWRLLPNRTAEDSADIAAMLLRDAGERADKLPMAMQGIEKMQSLGVDPTDALARLTNAMQKKMRPSAFSTVASNLASAMDKAYAIEKTPGKPLTDDQKILMSIKGMSAGDLMTWADTATDEQMRAVFGTGRAQIGPMFGPGVGAAGMAAMRKAATENLATTEAAAIRGSAAGSMVYASEVGQAGAGQITVADNRLGGIGNVRQIYQDILGNASTVGKMERDLIMTGLEARLRLGGDPYEVGTGTAESMLNVYGSETVTTYPSAGFPGTGYPVTERNRNYDPELKAVLSKILEVLERAEQANSGAAIGAGMD